MKKARFSSIQPIDRTLIRCYHSGPEWTWERWQWRGTRHSPKLQHCWNLTIRLFSVISRTLVSGGGLTPLQRSSQYILQPQSTGQTPTLVQSRPGSNGTVLFIFSELGPRYLMQSKTQTPLQKIYILNFNNSAWEIWVLEVLLYISQSYHATVLEVR